MKNLLTNRKQSDIINKLLREKRQTIKSDLEGLKSDSKINFEKPLDKLEKMWYNRKACETKQAKLPRSHRNERKSRKLQKSLKNLLTNSKRCDIITKSSERSERQS